MTRQMTVNRAPTENEGLEFLLMLFVAGDFIPQIIYATALVGEIKATHHMVSAQKLKHMCLVRGPTCLSDTYPDALRFMGRPFPGELKHWKWNSCTDNWIQWGENFRQRLRGRERGRDIGERTKNFGEGEERDKERDEGSWSVYSCCRGAETAWTVLFAWTKKKIKNNVVVFCC